MLNKIKAVMLGHAVGDALGVPVEFSWRDELQKNPIVDMRGFGAYPYPAGTWSDDTSMSLATLDSLSKGYIDFDDIMNNFGLWLGDGKYTPTGEVFDSGRTCVTAIANYFVRNAKAIESGEKDELSNGNGSLMRIHPFVLYLYSKGDLNLETIHNASALTHFHERSKIACGIYSFILWELLNIPSKTAIKSGLKKAAKFYGDYKELAAYQRIFSNDFQNLNEDDIESNGYVVYTFEAAIWCLLNTDSYKECVLKAVNLGRDTDTVAAIAGGLAGMLYGYESIPKEWLQTLIKREYIEAMCMRAAKIWK